MSEGHATTSLDSGQIPSPEWVSGLLQEFTALWWQSGTHTPNLGRTYTAQERSDREAQLVRFQDAVSSEGRRVPRTRSERQAAQERILSAFRAFARIALGFGDSHMDVLLERGLPQVGTQFAQTARRFDTSIAGSDIFQAMRNVWTMNCVQLLLGLPIRLTPAVFAYSMLYPYTDNYLDDPTVSEETKQTFNERFGRKACVGCGRCSRVCGAGQQLANILTDIAKKAEA